MVESRIDTQRAVILTPLILHLHFSLRERFLGGANLFEVATRRHRRINFLKPLLALDPFLAIRALGKLLAGLLIHYLREIIPRHVQLAIILGGANAANILPHRFALAFCQVDHFLRPRLP